MARKECEGARKIEGVGEKLKESFMSITGFHFSFSSLKVSFI